MRDEAGVEDDEEVMREPEHFEVRASTTAIYMCNNPAGKTRIKHVFLPQMWFLHAWNDCVLTTVMLDRERFLELDYIVRARHML